MLGPFLDNFPLSDRQSHYKNSKVSAVDRKKIREKESAGLISI